MTTFKLTLFIFASLIWGRKSNSDTTPASDLQHVEQSVASSADLLFEEMALEGTINYDAFAKAVKGYESIAEHQNETLVIIDFSKPSTDERLYVLDMSSKKMLYNSHVAHGRNSGDKYATKFSNKPGSYQSSLGFYLTGNTYNGSNGYSLVLHGLEDGINDKARERAIVIHGADYCNPSVIKNSGRLGRSYGCPALPNNLSRPIIDTIKEGAVLFIYADDEQYSQMSPILSM